MAFDIDIFRTHFSNNNEVSKADKFDVFISLPPIVARTSGYSTRELALQCDIAELPGRDIQMIEYRHYGFTRRVPHINQYGHITFNFICTGQFTEKQLFDTWLDTMIPQQTGLVKYAEQDDGTSVYESQIEINQYDQQGNLVYTAKLLDAIPTSVSPLSLDWSNDSIHKLSVTFAYRKWFTDDLVIPTGKDFPINNYIPPESQISDNFPSPLPPGSDASNDNSTENA